MRDDDLHDRLAGLVAEAGLTLPDSRDVRARGDQRRARVPVVAAGLNIVVTGGVVGAAWSASGSLRAPVAAGATASAGKFSAMPSSSASASPTGSPAPSGSASTPPTGSPASSSAPVSSHPHSLPPSSGSSFPTTIPASLSMLHEGEAGWTTSNNPKVPSAFNPCAGADVTATGRTDARTLKGPGLPDEESHSPSKVTHQLFLYATPQAANAAFVKLSAGGCGWSRSAMDDGSNHLARLRKSESYDPTPGVYWLHDADLVRTGNALLVVHADTSGAGMTSDTADQELGYILKPLCEAQLVCW